MNTFLNPLSRKKISSRTQNKGFTLLELIITMLILGVLSAMALPLLMKQVEKSRTVDARSNLGAINRAQQAYYFENSTFAPSLQELTSQVNIGSWNGSRYETTYYTYELTNVTATEVHHLAEPLNLYNQDIKSLAASVFKDGNEFTSKVCQADAAGTTPEITAVDNCTGGEFTN